MHFARDEQAKTTPYCPITQIIIISFLWEFHWHPWFTCTCTMLEKNFKQTFDWFFIVNSKIIDRLLPKHKAKVLERISEKLPLQVTANLIQDDGYWKRCCKSRWDICDVKQYGNNWKRMFFERYALVWNGMKSVYETSIFDHHAPFLKPYVHTTIKAVTATVAHCSNSRLDSIPQLDAQMQHLYNIYYFRMLFWEIHK